jgi:intraflagellar transport protein 122
MHVSPPPPVSPLCVWLQLSGLQHGKDRKLDFDPCTVSYFNNGEYLLVGGSDRKVTLMTKEGVKIMEVCSRDDWVWAAKARPRQNYVAVAANDGTVTLYQLIFSTVHGLYQVPSTCPVLDMRSCACVCVE